MPRIIDDSMALTGRCLNRASKDPRGWTDGHVVTPRGIVAVYAQGGDGHVNHTRLDFAWKGRLYMREMPKVRLSSRGMVSAARRFAQEVVDANP